MDLQHDGGVGRGRERDAAAVDLDDLPRQLPADRLPEPRQFPLAQPRPGLVEFDGKPLAVADGQVRPDAFRHRDDLERKAAAAQHLLEPLAGLAARGRDGQRLSAEGVNHAGRVDAAPSGRFRGGHDVGAVFEHQAVGRHVLVDRRVHGERQDQALILARSRCGAAAPTNVDGCGPHERRRPRPPRVSRVGLD